MTKEKTSGPQSGALAPVAAFTLLLVLIAAGAAAYLLTGSNEADPAPAANPSPTASTPDHQLTDAEAIAVFEALDRSRARALETRNRTLADSVYVDGVKVEKRILQDINRLELTNTTLETRFQTTELDVTRIAPVEIRLRQTVLVDAEFSRKGKDVDRIEGTERQVIDWILRYVDDRWLIRDAVVRKAELVK